MKRIGDFLARFTNYADNKDVVKGAVFMALKEAGVQLRELGQVTVKGTVVLLKISPAQKSDVFLKQKRILLEFKKNPLTENLTKVI